MKFSSYITTKLPQELLFAFISIPSIQVFKYSKFKIIKRNSKKITFNEIFELKL